MDVSDTNHKQCVYDEVSTSLRTMFWFAQDYIFDDDDDEDDDDDDDDDDEGLACSFSNASKGWFPRPQIVDRRGS